MKKKLGLFFALMIAFAVVSSFIDSVLGIDMSGVSMFSRLIHWFMYMAWGAVLIKILEYLRKDEKTKEAIISFDLWEKYFEFFKSLENEFGASLSNKMNGKKIISYVESKFYERNGDIKKLKAIDYPDSEQICFKIKDGKSLICLSFYCADTSKVWIEFSSLIKENENEKEEDPCEDLLYTYSCEIRSLFLPEIIDATAHWIQTGELSDYLKDRVEKC